MKSESWKSEAEAHLDVGAMAERHGLAVFVAVVWKEAEEICGPVMSQIVPPAKFIRWSPTPQYLRM